MEPTAPSLARTYSDRVYDDPWKKVLDYRRVQRHAAEHPNQGSHAASTRLELPRARIDPWMNGAQPEPVKAIQIAIGYGWLDPDPESEIAHRLVDLLAHVLAGGSIAEDHPRVSLSPGRRVDVDELQRVFDGVGVESEVRHADDEQATEVVATDDGVILGRCLIAMGAPRGYKSGLESLPEVLDEVTRSALLSFVSIYARHRAVSYPEKDTLRIQEERSPDYHRELANLFSAVTGGAVTPEENAITISADAARELDLETDLA